MTLKNEIALTYLRARYGEEDIITSVATAEYTRKNRKNTYTGRINYAGRSGSASGNMEAEEQTPGGVGIQVQGEVDASLLTEMEHYDQCRFCHQILPGHYCRCSIAHYLKNDWEIGGTCRLQTGSCLQQAL